MRTFELFMRSIRAARFAREMDRQNTADAFDEIVNNLLELLGTEAETEDRASRQPVSKRLPQRLSTRKRPQLEQQSCTNL